jgi:hypothetical protein
MNARQHIVWSEQTDSHVRAPLYANVDWGDTAKHKGGMPDENVTTIYIVFKKRSEPPPNCTLCR